MPIALFLQAIQALTGSQFVKDRLQRSEHVIRVLKAVGIDPEHPPEDFEAVYAYALVEYGYGKPDVCLEIFRAAEIRSGFRRSFDGNDPQGWLTSGEAFLVSSDIGEKVRSSGCNPRDELAEFAAAFLKVTRRSQTPKETLVQHQLRKIERTIDRKLEQVAGQLEAIGKSAALSPSETLALASASCRAAGLADQMRSWFEVLGYRLEKSEKWELDYFEWVIEIPKRRGFDRVLVRGIVGEVGVKDVMALRESVGASRVDEGWVVTARRISKVARSIVEQPENADLFCFTFDEFLDQDADFEGYATWLMGDIEARGIEARYVPLACTKEEVDAVTHQRLGMSRYGESDGWTEGYIDLWLDDPAKEHLSILGEFGTGKTWLTLHYATIALRKYQLAKAAGIERPRLPIVIPLRDYAKAVSVESLFSEFFFRKHEIPIPGYSAFEELNRMGKLLLIFDGFDEMAARVDKQQMINNFWELAKVVVPGSKVILTCRTEHFPDAKEGRSLLNAELQASTRGLSGETPQFEVLELEKFEDSQIRSVLLLASSAETVEQVMGNPQLLDLARRPVMTELILEALPDIEAGKPVDMSRVYLYAVRRKMERDIRAERTFTSMADKLYFLCELSWEMLSNDKMSINYREFPDRIRTLFGSAVQEEKDLDHWHYDMMGQTMLIRNSDGDYTPAHRSLLEFFVAFKFAAELGALAPDFLELAQMKSGIDRTLEPREYTWSEYFGGGAVAPLKGFVTESLEKLRSGFGKEVLSRAVTDLLLPIIKFWNEDTIRDLLDKTILKTRNQSFQSVYYIGGNAITLLIKSINGDLSKSNFSDMVLCGADLSNSLLIDVNFSNSDLRDAKLPKVFGGIFALTLSKNRKLLATTGSSCAIDVWKEGSSEPFLKLKGHLEWIRALAFNHNDTILYSSSFDHTIRAWDISNGKCHHIFNGHSNRVNSVQSSSDGKYIVSASDDLTIKVWDAYLGGCLATLVGHTKEVEYVVITKCSKKIISASSDKTIKIWDLESGQCLETLEGHSDRVRSLALNKNEDYLASVAFDQTVRLWNLSSGNCERIFYGHTHPKISSVLFDDSDNRIITASYDQTIKIWNINTGDCLKTLVGHSDWVRTIGIDLHGYLVSGSDDQTIRRWDLNTGDCIETLKGITGQVRSLALSPDSKILAIGTEDIGIKIWSGINSDSFSTKVLKIKSFRGHDSRINSIQINPDGNLLATASFDKTAKVWDLGSRTCKYVFRGHDGCVNSVVFIPNRNLLATVSADSTIRIWNLDDGLCTAILEGHQDWLWAVAASPNGKLLASGGSNNIIKIWDVEKGLLINDLYGHKGSVNAIKFTPDGKFLISASSDRDLRIWSLDEMKILHVLNGHENYILDVDVSHDGRFIASCGQDRVIKIWNMQTKEILRNLVGHTDGVRSLIFTPDGERLISGGFDGKIRIWNVETGESERTLSPATPLARMNITGVKGLTPGTIASLKALGAIENEEVRM